MIRAEEIRQCLRDVDLAELAAHGGSFEVWERLVAALAGEWHEDLSERLLLAAPEIAGRAARLWTAALKERADRDRRDGSFAARRDLYSRDWRARAAAVRLLAGLDSPVDEPIPPSSILDGTLASRALAAAINETFSVPHQTVQGAARSYLDARAAGADRDMAAARAMLEAVIPDAPADAEALMLGAAAACCLRPAPDGAGLRPRNRAAVPSSDERDVLTSAVAVIRGHGTVRAAIAGPAAVAEMAGRAIAGHPESASRVTHQGLEGHEHLLAIDGLLAARLPDDVFRLVAILTLPAARRRLQELAARRGTGDNLRETLESLAEALTAAGEAARSLADHLGAPHETCPGCFRPGGRLYEAVPRGRHPAALILHGRAGREIRLRAVADADGGHAGWAAFDPLSREFRGQPLRAAYGLDGALVGRIETDEGGWRFRAGRPAGGFVTAPDRF